MTVYIKLVFTSEASAKYYAIKPSRREMIQTALLTGDLGLVVLALCNLTLVCLCGVLRAVRTYSHTIFS